MAARTLTAAAGTGVRARAGAARLHLDRYATAVVFLVPALTLFTLFVILPMGEAAWYSLFDWNGYGAPTDLGLQNYQRLLAHGVFAKALANTGTIILVSLLVQLPLALWMALILAEKLPGRVLFRTIFFMPYILADIVAGLIWRFIYDGQYGLVAEIWRSFGAAPPFVLAERDLALYAILVVIVWKYFGFHMMIYIAGLQNIPAEMIEAAQLDGATRRQIVWHVKIPMLYPVIRLSVFFAVLGSLQFFDLLMPLTGGGPSNSTHTVVTYLYTFGIVRMKIGFGSAVGVVLFVICVAFAFGYRRTLMRHD